MKPRSFLEHHLWTYMDRENMTSASPDARTTFVVYSFVNDLSPELEDELWQRWLLSFEETGEEEGA